MTMVEAMLSFDAPFSWRKHERARQLQESALLGALARIPREVEGFEATCSAVLGELASNFDADAAVLALVDEHDGVEVIALQRRPLSSDALAALHQQVLETLLCERRMVRFGEVTVLDLDPAADSVASSAPRSSFHSAAVHAGERVFGMLALAGGELATEAGPWLETLAHQAQLVCEHARLIERVRALSIRDGLTGAFTRRHIVEKLAMELERARRHRTPLSVVVFDLDELGAINRAHGTAAGSAVLREAARRLAENLRGSDAIGRFGDDSFLVILPHTPEEGARVVAERGRALIEGTPFELGASAPVRCTVSAGIASASSPRVHGSAGLVCEAEQSLLQAKQAGRNRVG